MVLYRTLIMNPVFGYPYGSPADHPCWYAAPYFDQIAEFIKQHNPANQVIELKESQDVRSNVWDIMKKYAGTKTGALAFVTGVGHGCDTLYTGYWLNYIYWVDMTKNGFKPDWARGKIFYLLSCLTARQLGPWMVKKLGAWAYLGWKEDYVFWIDYGERKTKKNGHMTCDWYFFKPLEDAWAKSMVGWLPPGGVYDYIRQQYTQNIPIVRKYYGDDAATYLKADRDNMVLIGNRMYPPWVPMTFASAWKRAALAAAGVAVGVAGIYLFDKFRHHGIRI